MTSDEIIRPSVVTTTWLREPLIVLSSSYPPTPKIAFYRDTWQQHISLERKTGGVQIFTAEALEKPKAVLQGTTAPHHVIFVHPTETSPRSNSPFAVIVDPTGVPMPAVASISYRRDLKDRPENFRVLWVPDEGGSDDEAR